MRKIREEREDAAMLARRRRRRSRKMERRARALSNWRKIQGIVAGVHRTRVIARDIQRYGNPLVRDGLERFVSSFTKSQHNLNPNGEGNLPWGVLNPSSLFSVW